jgi:ATP-dependent Zn protease
MIRRNKLNIFLFIALSISIAVNFYNGLERAKTSSIQIDRAELIFEGDSINHLILRKNAAEVIRDSGKVTFEFDEELHDDISDLAKKKHIATTYQNYEKSPVWIDALINWGPLTFVILIFLLGANLSRKFNT